MRGSPLIDGSHVSAIRSHNRTKNVQIGDKGLDRRR